MTGKRLWYSFRMCTIRGGKARANYIRTKNVYASVGENCSIQKRKLPLYANLIKLGNNVHLASGVSFITHDITHTMLNNVPEIRERGKLQERVGCIEIGDNVFVGAATKILYNVRIGSNVIIGTGSLITKDVPSGSVVAGSPARVIDSFDDFVEKSLARERVPAELLPKKQTVSPELAEILWKRFDEEHSGI